MEIAASIQGSLICEPEVTCDFARVTGRTVSSKEVGGDFFDAHVSPDAVTVIVADVSGKGISAALLASDPRNVLRADLHRYQPRGSDRVDTSISVRSWSRTEGHNADGGP